MDRYAIGTIAEIARAAFEEKGYGASFGHETEDGHQAFYVSDLDSGRIFYEIVIKVSDLSKSQPQESGK